MKYNRLLILSQHAGRATCKCDCGEIKSIRLSHVKSGAIKSCGCYNREVAAKRKTTHGMTNTPEYRAYKDMRNRCYRQKDTQYANYGGRGITVCGRWIDSFENFISDMGLRPAEYSLDRIDSNGNYEPGNCRWTDEKTQQRNRRNNRLIQTKDGAMTVAEAAEKAGVSYKLFHKRLQKVK